MLQNCLVNRSESGTLNLFSDASPLVNVSFAFDILRLEAWPVPEDFRHREQWQ